MSTNKLTTVSTTYARIAVMLLAFNMLLTGYVVMALNKSTEANTLQKNEAPVSASEAKRVDGETPQP